MHGDAILDPVIPAPLRSSRLRAVAGFLAMALVLALAGCGSGTEATQRVGQPCTSATGGNALCLVQCNLGCTATGCSVSEISVNQPVLLTFNQNVDPDSVGAASVSMKTSDGLEPVGSYLVQGQLVFFLPEVRTIGSNTFFGFEQGRIYTLSLPGGDTSLSSVRSTAGDRLARSLTCFLNVSRGVVDLDGKPPDCTLVVPSAATNVPVDTEIVIHFSEMIDEAPFAGGATPDGAVQFKVIPTDGQGNCGQRTFTLDGELLVSSDRAAQRTVLRFRPAGVLPGETCVRVDVTSRVHDLSGKPAEARRFEFRTMAVPVRQLSVTEDFSTLVSLDSANTGAAWGNSELRPATAGGSGRLGPFTVIDGVFLGESNGIRSYLWSTTSQLVRGTRTLTGVDETVTDGVFEFSSFVLGRNDRVVFAGTRPVKILVRGRVDIQGAVDVSGASAPANFIGDPFNPPTDPTRGRGQPGSPGGPGGGRGGDGANSPAVTTFPRKIHGDPGQDAQVPGGHPYAAAAAGTGGTGSLAWPANADPVQICYMFAGGQITLMLQGGGGGGSLYKTMGTAGATRVVLPGQTFPCELAPASFSGNPGTLLFAPPVIPTVPSSVQFLIGGAGGGGGGTQPIDSFLLRPPVVWRAGGGGGGGGGALLVRNGGELLLAPSGSIRSRGGVGSMIPPTLPNTTFFGRATPSGGGSGGSILIQNSAGATPVLAGILDVQGGTGGVMTMNYQAPRYQSSGGDGGPGYIRIETAALLAPNQVGTWQPPLPAGEASNHLAVLGETDDVSGAQSLWYPTGFIFPPEYLRYEVEAEIGGNRQIFSDDAAVGTVPVYGQTPIAVFLQSAQLNFRGEPDLSTLSTWRATCSALNADRANGFRWVVLFDRGRLAAGTNLMVKSIKVTVRG